MRERSVEWGIAHATSLPMPLANSDSDVRGEGDKTADWLLFWRVMQKLMRERIVVSEPRVPGRPVRREAQRFGMPPSILRVIELRRAREEREQSERDGTAPTTWTHRWIARGHWHTYHTKQGPTQKWVGDYVKGPEHLDLIIKRRVWNWDR
jgi:hypothetical protein